MVPEFRIISIGTLAANPLWNEKGEVRTGHATTTLISTGAANILINPSLPPQAMLARMSERTPLKSADITHIFLTSFEADHRRAIRVFEDAEWLIHEPERDAARSGLNVTRDEAIESGDEELVRLIDSELAILETCKIAPDSLAPKIDLFPLPGVTAGTCGLLIALPGMTVLICGDAIPTVEHLSQGKVLPNCASISQAQESFKEAVEIADVLVLGRDNLTLNPLRRL
jgi:glyoxylase-like metal-dependent hydrolase (beta-lactamase superfamily II)